MTRSLSILGCLALAGSLASSSIGCSGPDGGRADASLRIDASSADASVPMDAAPPTDAPPSDAGLGKEDSGPDEGDAGRLKPDAGTDPGDAATADASTIPDAGTVDAGIVMIDASVLVIDAGTRDAGTSDAGTRDAGTSAACAEADLGSALGDALTTGTTVGATDDGNRSCGSSGAPDRTFTWTAPAAGTYVIDTNGSSYDTLIDVLSSCSGPVLGCDDDAGEGVDSAVRATLAAGQTIVIVIDGYAAASGAFVLNIHVDATEICLNAMDDDRDGDLDCDDFDCDADPVCTETGVVECFDLLDNDGDGAIDCRDFDCGTQPECTETGAVECHDDLDNDGDGSIDCADGDCDAACTEPGMCGDGVDNDEDTFADCADTECACDPLCAGASICPDRDIASAVGNGVATGVLAATSCSGRADTACGSGGPGGEIEIRWTAPSAGTYLITTYDSSAAGGTYDTILSVRAGSCTGAEVTCNDDTMGLLSSVTVTATAGQVFVIVIDAYGTADGGNWTLNITPM